MLGYLRKTRLKKKLGPPLIVVSGLPRSGTSMMMNMLQAAGLDVATDHERTADEDNPKGYFELEQVKDLDKADDKSWLRKHRGKVVKIISFLLKDLPDDLYYQTIFMRRDLDEVIASQNKMLVRRGEPTDPSGDERMIRNYRMHLKKTEFLLAERPNFDVLDVDYRRVIEHPRDEARRVARFLGRQLDPEKMATVVDRQLYRNRAEKA